jgi:outer membrane immunogenic protein
MVGRALKSAEKRIQIGEPKAMKENFLRGGYILAIALTALSSLIATPVLAADLAVKAPPPPPAPIANWTGFYVGVNGGWIGSAHGNVDNTGTDTGAGGLGAVLAAGGIPHSIGITNNGGLVGGTLGYNWQVTPLWLIGLEGDIDWVGAKSQTSVGPFPVIGPVFTTVSTELDWLSTVRGRIGYTPAPEALLYVTGGLAVGEHKLGNAAVDPLAGPPLNAASTTQSTSTGWTVGAGAEWRVAPQWSVKAEYLYVDLGSLNSTINYTYLPNTSSLTTHLHYDSYNIFRAGITYAFGGPAARY